MNSTIQITPNKILITIGAVVTLSVVIPVIISMVMYPVFWRWGGYLLLVLSGLSGFVSIYHKYAMLRIERNRARMLNFPGNHNVIDVNSGIVIVPAYNRQPEPQVIDMPLALPKPQLMDMIANEPCVLIHGRRNSGKTTTAMRWLSMRPGRKIVIDIKPKGENNWPQGCEVYGQNDNLKQVVKALEIASTEFERRKRQDYTTHSPLTIFVDELYYLYNIKQLDVFETFWEIVALGRSYNMHGGLTSSGKEVELLGAKGKGSLRDNLAFVRLKMTGSGRQCFVDVGDGEIEVNHPGPYFTTALPLLVSDADRIEQAFSPGKSLSAICVDAGLPRGGPYMEQVKDVAAGLGYEWNGKWIQVRNP